MPPIAIPHSAYPADIRDLLPRASSFISILSGRTSTTQSNAGRISDIVQNAPAIARRQAIGLIPTGYQFNGPTPGTVVGIVLGSVAGFLLIAILIFMATNKPSSGPSITGEEEIVVRRRDRSRSPHRSHRSRNSRSGRIREVREVSRSPRRPSRTIVEERIERVHDRTPQPRGSFIVDERIDTSRPPHRRVSGDDIVEVIEEHSVSTPPRRHRSKRSSGYRQVDPYLYAGGDYPQRPVRSRSRAS